MRDIVIRSRTDKSVFTKSSNDVSDITGDMPR